MKYAAIVSQHLVFQQTFLSGVNLPELDSYTECIALKSLIPEGQVSCIKTLEHREGTVPMFKLQCVVNVPTIKLHHLGTKQTCN